MPLLSGAPQQFRGEPPVDGGFVESLPYGSALREGATHVLVLRSRAAGYRLGPYPRLKELAMRIAGHDLVSMLRARPQRYNSEAEELERLASRPPGQPSVTQVTVPRDRGLVEHLATDVKQIQECIRLGQARLRRWCSAAGRTNSEPRRSSQNRQRPVSAVTRPDAAASRRAW